MLSLFVCDCEMEPFFDSVVRLFLCCGAARDVLDLKLKWLVLALQQKSKSACEVQLRQFHLISAGGRYRVLCWEALMMDGAHDCNM